VRRAHRITPAEGDAVAAQDLGDATLTGPAGRGELLAMLRDAVAVSGSYGALAARASEHEPDLA
jgi:hypothetical protein